MRRKKRLKPPKRRNPAAAALSNPRFRMRRVDPRKGKRGYSRKGAKGVADNDDHGGGD